MWTEADQKPNENIIVDGPQNPSNDITQALLLLTLSNKLTLK